MTGNGTATTGHVARREGARVLFDGPGEMRARCRALDWAATALGAPAAWDPSLRTAAETALASAFPAIVLWGPELVQLYNDAYVPFLGVKHPAGLGQPTHVCWPEVWHLNAPIYARVLAGETVFLEEAHFPVRRQGAEGPVEDLYITLSYSPVWGKAGGVDGVFITLVDTTAQVAGRAALAERQRMEVRLTGALLETALILDQVRDAHLVMDGEFRITAVNQSAERALARSRDALLGRTHWEAFPASVGAEPERQYRRVAAERVEAHFVHHYVGEGYDAHLEIDAYPTPTGGGVAVFWRDISERVRLLAEAEAARVEAEARAATLAAVIDSIPDAVLVGGPEGITLANQTALAQLGVPSVEALRAAAPPSSPLLPLEHVLLDPATGAGVPLAATPVGRALQGERSHAQFLLRALGAAGAAGAAGAPGPRPVRAAAAPIVGPDGALLGAVAVLTDMTRQHAAAAERERLLRESERARVDAEAARAEAEAASAQAQSAYAEAAAANRAKGEFLAVMSHELRTPLNAIGGYAELIELGIRGPVTPQQREDLARIQKSQRHLLGLINGVLNYSRAEAGAVHYDVGDVPLAAVLATCETLVAPQARAKQLALHLAACSETLAVRADREKVQQIVVNLLSNAVKFTAAGGAVTLACARDGRPGDAPRVVVTVTDTGRGIAADALERVFEPFVQVDTRLTRTEEGMGLGLAISRDLARGMGGDLTAESAPGVGSTFTLTLPSA